jgi:hypothetical protein
MRDLVLTRGRSAMVVAAVCAGVIAVGARVVLPAPGAAAAPAACARYAATPARVVHGDDLEFVHAAGSAMYCPDDVDVQVTACVQRQDGSGWTDVGCASSPTMHVTSHTTGGRGEAVSFDVPCLSGLLRTHVTGGEGLSPTAWDSDPATITCFGAGGGSTPPGNPPVDPAAPPASGGPGAAAGSGGQAGTPAASSGGPTALRPDTRGPAIAIGRRNRVITATAGGVVRLRLGPVDEDASGVLRLKAAGVALGSAGVHIHRDRRAVVRLTLSAKGRTALARRRTLSAEATLVLSDAAGNATTRVFRVTVRRRP